CHFYFTNSTMKISYHLVAVYNYQALPYRSTFHISTSLMYCVYHPYGSFLHSFKILVVPSESKELPRFLEEDFLLIVFPSWSSLLSDLVCSNRVETLHSAVTATLHNT
ncbi:MAG: hypothetical protein MRQ05_05115, partial [Candidatus Midichloria mitochondrii]|nr:hypothetical protein [Candidatus Midichloria mitochondrii]